MADEPQQAEHVNTAHQAIPVAIPPMPEFKPEANVGASLARVESVSTSRRSHVRVFK